MEQYKMDLYFYDGLIFFYFKIEQYKMAFDLLIIGFI